MAEAFDPHPAAAMLAQAWRSGTLLAELPRAVRPATMAQGYDIQDRLIAELGRPVVGWKLGLAARCRSGSPGWAGPSQGASSAPICTGPEMRYRCPTLPR